MFCTSCGAQAAAGSAFCSQCGKPLAAAQPGVSLDKAGSQPMWRPGQMDEEMPDGVKGWSWGAFLLNWIWAIGNRTWIGLLAIIPYVGFLVAIWLGFKGREMAWRTGGWQNLEHFNRVQRNWSRWGVGIVLAVFVFALASAILVPAHMADERSTAADSTAYDDFDDILPATPGTRLEGGRFNSDAVSLSAALNTSAGILKRTKGADGGYRMTVSGTPLFKGEDAQWQFPVRSFNQSNGREAILMASSGGRGNSCDTLFFFLLVDADRVSNTPLFGTCAAQGRYRQRGDTIALELPKTGGMSQILLRNGEVIEDGRTITLDKLNDPAR
ncbi:MAG: zinc ribbon domain-containing protein [Pseudomonadota bacterium]